MYIETDTLVDYLVDHARAIHVPDDDDWKVNANERIDDIRKQDITFKIKYITLFRQESRNISRKLT